MTSNHALFVVCLQTCVVNVWHGNTFWNYNPPHLLLCVFPENWMWTVRDFESCPCVCLQQTLVIFDLATKCSNTVQDNSVYISWVLYILCQGLCDPSFSDLTTPHLWIFLQSKSVDSYWLQYQWINLYTAICWRSFLSDSSEAKCHLLFVSDWVQPCPAPREGGACHQDGLPTGSKT